MKKVLLATFMFITVCSFGDSSSLKLATCKGAKDCKACKNCKYCKHCAKDGGTCGV